MSPSGADPAGLVSEWLRLRPAWSSGVKDGRATLSRSFDFSDEFDMGTFLTQLTELVTCDHGHDLERIDQELTSQVTLLHDKPELDRTFLRHAEECDALFEEFGESDEHDPYAEDVSDSPEEFLDEDVDWD